MPSPQVTVFNPNNLERLVSPERFGTYVTACNDDRQRAAELYQWTGQIGGSLLADFRHLEVLYRITIHNALSAHHNTLPNRPTGSQWFDNPSWVRHHWWDSHAQNSLDTAIRRANHKPRNKPRPSAVVSELNFGFWRYVISARYEQSFWIPALDRANWAIPESTATKRRTRLETNIRVLHKLRNRIAHHEPIFDPTTFVGQGGRALVYSLFDQTELLNEVLHWIDPSYASSARSASSVTKLLLARP
jgi:hypothetical protein